MAGGTNSLALILCLAWFSFKKRGDRKAILPPFLTPYLSVLFYDVCHLLGFHQLFFASEKKILNPRFKKKNLIHKEGFYTPLRCILLGQKRGTVSYQFVAQETIFVSSL